MNQIDQYNQEQIKQAAKISGQEKKIPEIKSGDLVRVHQKIKEGDKQRIQVFEGLVIAKKHGQGINATITVRRTASGVGVERIFPIHAPFVEKIEVVKRHKVRRAKLYYLRNKTAKEARLKEIPLKNKEQTKTETKKPKKVKKSETSSKKESNPKEKTAEK